MGLRTGTPDAEATNTTRSARLEPEVRARRAASPPGDAARLLCGPGVRDRDALAGPGLPLGAAVPHPRGQAVGRAGRETPRRLAGTPYRDRRCPTSGTASPCGSRPAAMAVSRAAARATTPFADGNGASASSSPCTTATSTGAGTDVRRPVDQARRAGAQAARAPTRRASGAGRPQLVAPVASGRQAGTRSRRAAPPARAAGPAPAAARVRQVPSSRPDSSAARTAPASTGSVTTPSARADRAPSSAADARAARSAASAADAAHPVRFTGWLCTATSASRARRTASATPGSSTSGASGSGRTPAMSAPHLLPGLTVRRATCGLASDPKRSAAALAPGRGGRERMAESGPTLSNLSTESRSFPPSEEFAAQANATEDWYARGDDDREAFWAEQADRLHWAPEVGQGPRLGRAVRQVVRRRQAQRRLQLRRPARRGRARRPGRDPLGGRAGRQPHHHLRRPAARGLQGRQRADRAGRAGGRPGGDPAADDPRGRVRDAGLRAAGRDAQRGVRRLLAGRAEGPHRGRRGQAADHLGRAVPPRQARADEGEHRRGRRGDRRPSSTCSSSGAPRPRCPGPRVATSGGTTSSTASPTRTSRGVRRRAPAVHPLHLGHHREAEGHPAHLRRLPHPGRVHAPRRVRPQARRERLLVHRRHRLGHRAQLHRLRAAGQPGHVGHVRGHPEHPARGPALGDHRRSTASRSTTPRPR